MSYFAKLDSNNNVIDVSVVDNEVLMIDGIESEQAGVDFLTSLWGHPFWKQTSYNTRGGVHILGGTPFRKNYAGVGFTYDVIKDAFIPAKCHEDAILNNETCLWACTNEGHTFREGSN